MRDSRADCPGRSSEANDLTTGACGASGGGTWTLALKIAASEKAGQPVDTARALRDAKRKLRGDPKWASASFWAPFVPAGVEWHTRPLASPVGGPFPVVPGEAYFVTMATTVPYTPSRY